METIKQSASLLLVLILLFSCFAPVVPVSAEELPDSEPPQASAAAPPGEKIPESTAETISDPTVEQEETIAETEPTEPLIPETQPPIQETNPEEQTTFTLASFLESCNASISIDFLDGFAVREGTQLEVSEAELDTKTLAACMEASGMSSIVKSCGFTLGIPNTEFEGISFQTKIYFNQSSFPALNGKCVSVVQIYPDGRMKRLEASSFVEEKRLQELAFSVENFTHGTQFVILASDHPTVLVAHSIWGVYAVQGYQNISVGQASRLHDVTYHYVDDPSTPGYCLEPHKTFGYATGGGASSSTVGISSWGSQHGDTVWSGLNENQRKAIGLIAMLGLNQNTFDWGSHSSSGTSVLNPVNPNQCSFAAAQIMIWEVVGGWRSFPNPSVCYDSRVIDNFDRGNVRSAYDALNGKIRAWEQTTIGRRLSVENSRYRLSWVTSRDQVVLTVTQFAYETLVPPTGNIRVSKNVRGSGSVQNWKFELYRSRANADSAAGPVMSAYTNSQGVATFYNVNNGTCYIREAPASRQDRVNATGWGLSSSVLQGTVNGSNISVGTITNTAPAGAIRVKKSLDSSNTAGKLNGWIFQVSGSRNFSSITTTIATDANGEGTTGKVLSPGTYYVREAPMDQQKRSDKANFQLDNRVVTVTISGSETVLADNGTGVTANNVELGAIRIRKGVVGTGAKPETLKGWLFDVYLGEKKVGQITTGADGYGICEKLVPGEYTVREAPMAEQTRVDKTMWLQSSSPVHVTVAAGVTVDALQDSGYTAQNCYGKQLTIQKVNPQGEALAGAKFLLEWSEDGALWKPVSKVDVIAPGSCTSGDLEEGGCITTGDTGKALFSGLCPTVRYRISEMATPNGYQLLKEPILVETLMEAQNYEAVYRVVDTYEFTLPRTGSVQLIVLTMTTALLMTGGGCCWISAYAQRKMTKKKGFEK